MPNKTQAKAAIDAAAVDAKNDVDLILPVGVNISDGKIEFSSPSRRYIRMTAPDQTTADSWTTTIVANLTAAARPSSTRREGSYVNSEKENVITITSTATIFVITGF